MKAQGRLGSVVFSSSSQARIFSSFDCNDALSSTMLNSTILLTPRRTTTQSLMEISKPSNPVLLTVRVSSSSLLWPGQRMVALDGEYDAHVFTETWLDGLIHCNFRWVFNVYRRDRDTANSIRTGGGSMLIAVSKVLDTCLINDKRVTSIETIWVKVKLHSSENFDWSSVEGCAL